MTPEELEQLEIKTSKYGGLIPIPKADYEALKTWIAQDKKLHYPILINQHGDVLDGHNRLKICQEFGIKPQFEIIPFDNDLEEERFVRLINVSRRHMNAFQKAEQAYALEPIEGELARQRQLAGKKATETLCSDEPKVKGRVREIVAKVVDLPPTTYFRARKIIQEGSEEIQQKLREDRAEITAQYNKIMRAQKRIEVRAETEAFAKTLSLPEKVTLLNKDSTKLDELTEIPDNSVDLIITDPPYLDKNLHLFEALAKFAVCKLKEGGSLVFYPGQYQLPEILSLFSKYESEEGLFYQWQLAIMHEGSQARFHALGVQVGWKAMLWYKKKKKGDRRYESHKPAWQPDFCDVIYSTPPDKTMHDWAQSSVEAEYIINKLTVNEHALVVDPFMGSGAFLIPAIKLGRYAIGIELDKEHFEDAQNYIKSETSP